jgi:hypothetical protein
MKNKSIEDVVVQTIYQTGVSVDDIELYINLSYLVTDFSM